MNKMILLDTNILSTFAVVGKLDLLFKIFKKGPLCISPNVLFEVNKAKHFGHEHANSILELVSNEQIEVISLTENELLLTIELPSSFGFGERDSVIIVRERNGVFVTNEKKVINYCNNNGISCLWLNEILRYLLELKVLTKQELQNLIEDIESKDKLKITKKDEILKE